MPAPHIATSVTWVERARTTRGGTAAVASDQADWRPHNAAAPCYPILRRSALKVTAAGTFGVTVSCEGGFSGAADPPEMSNVCFYLGSHHTAAGTAVSLLFQRDGDEVLHDGDRWVMTWRCSGVLRLPDGIEVQFRTGVTVDTFAMFRIQAPTSRCVGAPGAVLTSFGTDATGLVPTLVVTLCPR